MTATAVSTTTTAPATTSREPQTAFVDQLFDAATAWIVRGLIAGRKVLESGARALDAGAKRVSDLAEQLQKTPTEPSAANH